MIEYEALRVFKNVGPVSIEGYVLVYGLPARDFSVKCIRGVPENVDDVLLDFKAELPSTPYQERRNAGLKAILNENYGRASNILGKLEPSGEEKDLINAALSLCGVMQRHEKQPYDGKEFTCRLFRVWNTVKLSRASLDEDLISGFERYFGKKMGLLRSQIRSYELT